VGGDGDDNNRQFIDSQTGIAPKKCFTPFLKNLFLNYFMLL